MKKLMTAVTMSILVLTMGCSMASSTGAAKQQTFAEIHDAFTTNLTKQNNDQDVIPDPPAGVFELDYYDSKVGPLAAYVSSDPKDGKKHPLMIWAVGGWGSSIDEFAWSYPEWDNDQSASAFREAGILMMYPSFRGGNGNPGYYETLFGEVDDIVSAYEYAASLPYVDADRIYLGGHSTGGTKVLLASEYTDKFRAVFSFGPVDEIKYHNSSQFTFDTANKEEYKLRSPIHWLADVKSPTFLIEGEDGNAKNLKAIQKKSENENIYCYLVDNADHFSVLAPISRLLAEKIVNDTGAESNITLTDAELDTAMQQEPEIAYPIMVPFQHEDIGLMMEVPAIWECIEDSDEYTKLKFVSVYADDNFWDMSEMYLDVYDIESSVTFEDFEEMLSYQGDQYQCVERELNGTPLYIASGEEETIDYGDFYVKVAGFQKDAIYCELWFFIPDEYKDVADVMFEQIIESVQMQEIVEN